MKIYHRTSVKIDKILWYAFCYLFRDISIHINLNFNSKSQAQNNLPLTKVPVANSTGHCIVFNKLLYHLKDQM